MLEQCHIQIVKEAKRDISYMMIGKGVGMHNAKINVSGEHDVICSSDVMNFNTVRDCISYMEL